MAKKSGSTPGDVVRFDPAPEPMIAALAIGALTLLEMVFAIAFLFLLFTSGAKHVGQTIALGGATFTYAGNTTEVQQAEALLLGGALLTLAAILSLYRKFFLPDVMIVKKRKLKYEDLM
ncbi:MAG TPA: hypothetical protein VM370_11435 [Candidatus Thermoplasmatota archaeon]|nr:hypothetical protein [Candidatus Thermoplasmatota archaeon]